MAYLNLRSVVCMEGKSGRLKKEHWALFFPSSCFRNQTTQTIPLRYLIGRAFTVQQHSLKMKILKVCFLKVASLFFHTF